MIISVDSDLHRIFTQFCFYMLIICIYQQISEYPNIKSIEIQKHP